MADVKCAIRQLGVIGSERDCRLVQLAVLRSGVELANHVPALSGPLPPPQDLQLVVSAPRHIYVENGAIELPESITQWNFLADGYRVVWLQADVNAVRAGLFRKVEALGEVCLAAETRTVNPEAFADCTGLIEVHFGRRLRDIGTRAFARCTALVSVTLPATVTYLGQEAFCGCSALRHVDLPIAGRCFFDVCPWKL